MGWSCRKEAGDTMDRIEDACFKSAGRTNSWKNSRGDKFFLQLSQIERADGAITGGSVQIRIS